MTVGERIKEIRIQCGFSQVDFAIKLDVSKQTLYKYENNLITNIPSDKIELAAQLCNVSPAYIMGWEDKDGLTKKDNRDIKKDLDSLMGKLTSKEYGPAAYDGEDIPEEDQELFAGQLELMLRKLKKINKVKYNPYKNKDKK